MTNASVARLTNLAVKAVKAIPTVVLDPKSVVHAVRGAHWATLVALDHPWLRASNVRTVIDIGANTGQFATAARVVFPAARIYSFEPLPDCFDVLEKRMKGDRSFVAHRTAIGDRNGQATFHQSSFSESSSLLQMSDRHREAFPWTGGETEVTVPLRTLDSFLTQIDFAPPVLLKIDVQGFERQVLEGAARVLNHTSIIFVEVSFTQLYDGEASFDEVYSILRSSGFSFKGVIDQLEHPRTREILQGDAVFIRDAY